MGILRKIVGYVDLDGSGFEKNAIKVENQAMQMSKKVNEYLVGMGAGMVAGFGFDQLIKGAIDSVKHFHDLAEEFHITTDTAQRWDAAARHTGLTAEDVGNSFNRLKKARESAIAGDKASIEAFGALGVSMEMVRDRSKELSDITERMSTHLAGRSIADYEDAAAMDLFSKSGAKMVSVIQNLKEAGTIKLIDQQEIEEVDRAEKGLGKLWRGALRIVAIGLAKGVEGSTYFFKNVSLAVDVLSGKMSMAEARAKALDSAVEIFGGGYSKGPDSGPAAAGKQATFATTKVVDLHKDDNEILRGNLDLQEKIRRNNDATLTTTKHLAELKREIAEDEDKALRAMYEGNDLEAIKFAKKAEDRRAELISMEHKRGKDLSVDSLNRIGGLVGGHEQVIATTARQQLDTLRGTQKLTQDILQALLQSNPTIRESLLGGY
jgi:hypothetical protein